MMQPTGVIAYQRWGPLLIRLTEQSRDCVDVCKWRCSYRKIDSNAWTEEKRMLKSLLMQREIAIRRWALLLIRLIVTGVSLLC